MTRKIYLCQKTLSFHMQSQPHTVCNAVIYLFPAFCHDVRVIRGPDCDVVPVVLFHQGGDLNNTALLLWLKWPRLLSSTGDQSSTIVNTFCMSRSLFCLTSMLIGMWGNFLKTSSSRAILRSCPVPKCPDGDFKVFVFLFRLTESFSWRVLTFYCIGIWTYLPTLNVTSSFSL